MRIALVFSVPQLMHLIERMVSYCRPTSASTAPCTPRRMCCPMHCASYCAPRKPLLRAYSGWIRSPPPTAHSKPPLRYSKLQNPNCSRRKVCFLYQDWYFIADQPAPAPHLAHPEGCAALCMVLVTEPRVRCSCGHFPDGLDLHLLQPQ